MTQTTMPSLKEVGTKLGLETGKTGSMRMVAVYVNQHRGELLRKEQILSDLNLQDKDKPAIENCFHRGYILRGQNLGKDFYFIPNVSDQQLIDLRNQFQQLETFPEKKQQLIQNLIGNMASPSQATSNIPKDDGSPQTPPSQEEAFKESAERKMLIDKLKREIVVFEKAVLTMQSHLQQLEASGHEEQILESIRQDIQTTQMEIDSKKHVINLYQRRV